MNSQTFLLRVQFSLADISVKHERKIYGLLALFVDVGGLVYFLMIFIGMLIIPMSKFSYLILLA